MRAELQSALQLTERMETREMITRARLDDLKRASERALQAAGEDRAREARRRVAMARDVLSMQAASLAARNEGSLAVVTRGLLFPRRSAVATRRLRASLCVLTQALGADWEDAGAAAAAAASVAADEESEAAAMEEVESAVEAAIEAAMDEAARQEDVESTAATTGEEQVEELERAQPMPSSVEVAEEADEGEEGEEVAVLDDAHGAGNVPDDATGAPEADDGAGDADAGATDEDAWPPEATPPGPEAESAHAAGAAPLPLPQPVAQPPPTQLVGASAAVCKALVRTLLAEHQSMVAARVQVPPPPPPPSPPPPPPASDAGEAPQASAEASLEPEEPTVVRATSEGLLPPHGDLGGSTEDATLFAPHFDASHFAEVAQEREEPPQSAFAAWPEDADGSAAWPPAAEAAAEVPPSPLMSCVEDGDFEGAYTCLTSTLHALHVAWASVEARVITKPESWCLPCSAASRLREASEMHAGVMAALERAATADLDDGEGGGDAPAGSALMAFGCLNDLFGALEMATSEL